MIQRFAISLTALAMMCLCCIQTTYAQQQNNTQQPQQYQNNSQQTYQQSQQFQNTSQQTYQQSQQYPNTYSPNQAGQQQYQTQTPRQIQQQAQFQAQAGQQQPNGMQANQQTTSRQTLAVGKRVYPQGTQGTLIIEKHAPVEVRPNQPFSYVIRVINPTQETMRNVIVKETQPATFKIASSIPQPSNIKDGKQWALGDIAAGSTREIQINGQVSDANAQQIVSCVTVTHDVTGCWAIRVAEPKLKLAQTIPPVNLICDQIPLNLTVCNEGTGTARGVRVFAQLPQGISTLDGQTALAVNVGDIPAGKCAQVPVQLKATQPADFTVTSSARSSDGQTSEATTKFKVQQPILAITKTAPEKRLVGRKLKYDITVTNKSTVPAKNVRIVDTVASGVKVSGASSGGQLNQQTNEVVWSIPEIPGGDSVKLSLEVVPSTIGTLRNTATAVANCAPSVSAETTTRIEGIPAILLEVVDIEDPIEVGENVTYMVTVTNQGSAQGTNIRIECTLENSMQYVSSAGATMATPLENKIVFDALPTLKPKARASWKIVVRAAQSGDVRFMVKMTSDQISRHVVETEATNFYK
ncbi:MAG TPA: hypothetical protein DCM28_11175 [Phycisphaerales bacterium]|nr:hypothetical protein [Phycisphaerales bacterium]HCD33185.1 hypothetical protein [Phycisphaerales bacterium]|tara:strand:- start:1549 stop:3291 length:1743 start_codon:yes stop_codon:yes gene_type:complete